MFRTHSLLSFQTDAVPPKKRKRKIQVSFIRLSGENETWGSLAQPFSLTCIKKRREREKSGLTSYTRKMCVFFPIFLLCVCCIFVCLHTHTQVGRLWRLSLSVGNCTHLTWLTQTAHFTIYTQPPITSNILYWKALFLLGLSPPPPHRPYVLMDEWSAPLLSCCSVPKKNRFNTRIDSTLLH